MKYIRGFPLSRAEDDGRIHLRMPWGAQCLSAGSWDDEYFLWALIDSEEPQQDRYFRLYRNGQPIEHAPGIYIATLALPPVVYHVFEVDVRR